RKNFPKTFPKLSQDFPKALERLSAPFGRTLESRGTEDHRREPAAKSLRENKTLSWDSDTINTECLCLVLLRGALNDLDRSRLLINVLRSKSYGADLRAEGAGIKTRKTHLINVAISSFLMRPGEDSDPYHSR